MALDASPQSSEAGGGDAGSDAAGVAPPGSYASAVLADGPRVYLRLEESSGDGEAGRVGRAARFDGQSCSLSLGNALPCAGKAPYTIEGWLKPAVANGLARFMAYRGPPVEGTSRLQILFNDQGIQHERADSSNRASGSAGPAPLPAGTFTHVAVVFDGAKAHVFVNGTEAGASGTGGDLTVSSADELVFGDTAVRVFYEYEGLMDELAVYDEALTSARIRAHFEAAP